MSHRASSCVWASTTAKPACRVALLEACVKLSAAQILQP